MSVDGQGSVELFERLLVATGLITAKQRDSLREEQGNSTSEALCQTLLEKGWLDQQQIDTILALTNKSKASVEKDPELNQLAFLKNLTQKGNIEEARKLLENLSENPVYERLGRHIIRAACLKNPAYQKILDAAEKKLASKKLQAPSRSKDSFRAFVELKKAVSLGDIKACTELERTLRDDPDFGRAAFQLVQKAFLSQAVASARRSKVELTIIKCPSCKTAYALQQKQKKGCIFCGEVIDGPN